MATKYKFSLPNSNWVQATTPANMDFLLARAAEVEQPVFMPPTISGLTAALAEDADMQAVMKDNLARLEQAGQNPRVEQGEVSPDGNAGLQQVTLSASAEDGTRGEVAQLQNYLILREQGGAQRWVVMLALTADVGRIQELAPEFQQLLDSVEFV
ncbi:hypothetical protein CKJ81_02950 [Corynebacterium hadale]|uniref:DUF1795 domain-containing protein n=2 Tax=Corynebacterium TaxID=1716 RepID=A0ABX4HBZ6_9CORY|nr:MULTISPECIES: hypothetical protein [Corynebacterium]PAT06904.1 hypothetical protein CKJ81_02950 [Corynebacterium hadale]RMD20379.1 hypothetical protein EAW56_01870 [Corynebacterium gottingense]WJZ12790.1 hypothetical protein CGOTT_04225 [Corynebacterium gottingense]WJZ15115.1 hypothetical protein CGOTTB_04245 [Corynebacterium gottingense]